MSADAGERLEVAAVAPCLNERRTLAVCIGKAQACTARRGVTGEASVADKGSTDRSIEIARSLGARVVHPPVRWRWSAARRGGVTTVTAA